MYRVIVGGNFGPDNRRVEIGDVLDDLSARTAKSLIGIGMIEPVEASTEAGPDGPDLP